MLFRSQPRYRYALVDMATGRQVAEHIPARVSTFERLLGDAGTADAVVQLRDPRVRRLDVMGATVPARTELCVYRDGVPVYDGMVLSRRYDGGSGALTIRTAETARSWLARRLLRPLGGPGSQRHLSFSQTDQFDIFRALLSDAQAQGDLRIDATPGQYSGVERDRHRTDDGENSAYNGFEFADYLTRLDQLADLVNGFEWRVDPYIDADRMPRRRLVLGFPYLGAAPGPDTVTLEYPGEIASFTWDEDGAETATYVAALGAGEEEEMRWSEAIDDQALGFGWPLLETTASHKSASDPSTLRGHAGAALARVRGNVVIPEVTVVGRPPVEPGSWVRLRIRDRALFGERPHNEFVRVVGIKTTPEPTETTTLQVEGAR